MSLEMAPFESSGTLFSFYSNCGRICSRLRYTASKNGVTLKTLAACWEQVLISNSWRVDLVVTERQWSRKDGYDDEWVPVERRGSSSSRSGGSGGDAGLSSDVNSTKSPSRAAGVTGRARLRASSPASSPAPAISPAAAASLRRLPAAVRLVRYRRVLRRGQSVGRRAIDLLPAARRPLYRLPGCVPARRLLVRDVTSGRSVLPQLLRRSGGRDAAALLGGRFRPSPVGPRDWRAVPLPSTVGDHQTGAGLSVDEQRVVLRSDLRLDARPRRPHRPGARRRAGPERLRLSVAGLLSSSAPVQGQVQADQPHPRPHRRETVSVSVSRLRQSVCT